MKLFKTSFYFFATVFVLTTSVSAAENKNIGDGGVRKLGKRAKASKEYVCDQDQYTSTSHLPRNHFFLTQYQQI